MRHARSIAWMFAALALPAASIHAQAPPDELKPKPATLAKASHDVAEVLRQLEAQTGNRVVDRRSSGEPRRVDIGFEQEPFWPALDQLAEALKARVSLFEEGGTVALVDGPPRRGAVSYAGVCRLEVKHLGVQLDLETKQRTCIVRLETAWEPRLEPLYLTVEKVAGRYAAVPGVKATAFEDPSRVAQSVARRSAQDVELRFKGPLRSSPKIDRLTGALRFVGPVKMLTFRFDKLAILRAGASVSSTQEEVTVAITRFAPGKESWSLDLLIRNPDDTPAFETYQSWLDNNRIHLEKSVAGLLVVWPHQPDEEQMLGDLTPRQAPVRYYFGGAQGKGDPGDWVLVYRTPGRMVEWTIPFEFKDLDLP